ncbi:hypothetical protein RYX56_19045 [Alkalihalophilus lindianensis]|uniref:Immunity protein 50 n=1 Tax=Alkalihalophilus lindianensis TaxID=1630542 RepID=A0ABU3XF00_9BACI|nr:hypothetical protein [Alkalihalophilus lindianensis]MDV2686470.1 hypothetical protein [Alkalihalophilus lindianensis]
MTYYAKVKGFNPHVEQEVILDLNGIELTGFMPFGISFEPLKEKLYPINISLVVLDELEVNEQQGLEKGLFRIEKSFSYFINGHLSCEERMINVGFDLNLEEDIIEDLWPYNNKTIQLQVDRINIEFLED